MGESRTTGVVGLGLDLVEVDRLGSAIERHGERFLRRVFTEGERDYCGAKSEPAVFLCGSLCCKGGGGQGFWDGDWCGHRMA